MNVLNIYHTFFFCIYKNILEENLLIPIFFPLIIWNTEEHQSSPWFVYKSISGRKCLASTRNFFSSEHTLIYISNTCLLCNLICSIFWCWLSSHHPICVQHPSLACFCPGSTLNRLTAMSTLICIKHSLLYLLIKQIVLIQFKNMTYVRHAVPKLHIFFKFTWEPLPMYTMKMAQTKLRLFPELQLVRDFIPWNSNPRVWEALVTARAGVLNSHSTLKSPSELWLLKVPIAQMNCTRISGRWDPGLSS